MTANTTAVLYPISLERGITKKFRLRFRERGTTDPLPLTGWAAKMQLRETARSATIIMELSTENGRIEIDGAAGIVTLIFPHTETIKLTSPAEHDLLLIDPEGEPMRVIYGTATPVWTVTR